MLYNNIYPIFERRGGDVHIRGAVSYMQHAACRRRRIHAADTKIQADEAELNTDTIQAKAARYVVRNLRIQLDTDIQCGLTQIYRNSGTQYTVALSVCFVSISQTSDCQWWFCCKQIEFELDNNSAYRYRD